MRALMTLLLVFAVSTAFAAEDAVIVNLTKKASPRTEVVFEADVSLVNSACKWSFTFWNMRAHESKGRHFQFRSGNGVTSGYCGLIGSLGLTVNGIGWDKLQVEPKTVREFSDGDAKGVEFALNFDGAPIRLRASMRPGSPTLDWEVSSSAKGLTPVTNVDVRVCAIPSHLDIPNKKTRFFGYRRQVKTDKRLMPPQKGGKVRLPGDERIFVLEDADFDGTAADSGRGPSAIILPEPVTGYVNLNDSWTTDVHFTPALTKPFRFSVLEYPEKRFSNSNFEKLVENMFK